MNDAVFVVIWATLISLASLVAIAVFDLEANDQRLPQGTGVTAEQPMQQANQVDETMSRFVER